MAKKKIIDVTDVIKKICNLYEMEWNDACDEVEFCKYELSVERWGLEDVNELLSENPTSKVFNDLKEIMNKKKLTEVTILRE